MGNVNVKKRNAQFSRNVKAERRSSSSSDLTNRSVPQLPRPQQRQEQPPPPPPMMMQRKSSKNNRSSGESSVVAGKESAKKKYALIPDNFTTLEQVTAALRKEGLESSNLILGIDFTKSNEWTGKMSFNNRSLHAIGATPNPYEKAISIIGKTLAPFDDDNLIPCFGFGDVTTHDQEVFSFHSDHSSCHGFEEVLACYQKIVPNLKLSGPTSYGPVIEAAIDIVEKNRGQFHVLVIIADGQVTRSVNCDDKELSPQEQKTIQSIVDASSYPLSIILVGVGDGPWEDMRKFDDKIPARDFDNFQFVNFTDIMSKNSSPSQKEAAFALAALMEIPFQYKAAIELGILGRVTGRAKKIIPRPPPVPYSRPAPPARVPSNIHSSTDDERNQQVCPICLTNAKDLAFGCGHMTCRDCGARLTNCPICRERITSRLRVFTG
ncbi:E3 ubiquitin-protein ligase RGLG4-like isoform X1 [Prosopis cineraria]|uniref:E3 ubiquitin-protein ligase RGLG4-like isoform X1 n=2 Tax=Prosopis cineraria TaxID=364024 RepID=UPI00240FB686|nr:E3 ubiquitin-protein ligase RGLG4-like isoform X1 [Prosopis cineraria]XP_054791323.1 E3 ubiquitin-protein ligase RGLG4-like isoform X1 [Prosopis cineraria]